MTDDLHPNPQAGDKPNLGSPEERRTFFRLPGLFATGAYMILLAIEIVAYVVQGRIRPLFLLFSVLFIAAGLGLMLLLRWAWALTLAAVALLAGSFFWGFVSQHMPYLLVQGAINLIIFFYLVRTEVRAKLH